MEKGELFKFYLSIRSEQVEWMGLHSRQFSYYVTLLTAVLGVTFGAVYQFRGDETFMCGAASLGLLVNIVLCRVAAAAYDRFYQRFLESVTILAKLEAFFGLDGSFPPVASRDDKSMVFPGDAYLLPERWLRARKQRTSKQFVRDNMSRGANRWARLATVGIALMNFLLWVLVVWVVASH